MGTLFAFGALCPAGFTERVDLANMYLRGHDGDATLGETGGATTHSHQVAAHTHAIAPAGVAHSHRVSLAASPNTVNVTPSDTVNTIAAHPEHTHLQFSTSTAGGPHVHTLEAGAAFASGAAINEPPFREVVLCEVTGTPTNVPVAAMVFSESPCSRGWSTVSFAGRLLRVHDLDGDLSEIGGSGLHAHTLVHGHGSTSMAGDHVHTFATGAPVGRFSAVMAGLLLLPTSGHRHTFTLTGAHSHTLAPFGGSSTPTDAIPENREVFACSPPEPAPLPPEALVLAIGPCPTGWVEVPSYRNRFFSGDDGDATFGEVSGGPHTHNGSHGHGDTGVTDHRGALTSTALPDAIGVQPGSEPIVSSRDHVHVPTISPEDAHFHTTDTAAPEMSMDLALPPYIEVIVCKRQPN